MLWPITLIWGSFKFFLFCIFFLQLLAIFLQHCLGYPQPEYYHVPLLLAPDGRRLSKREQDLDLGVLRQRCRPEQLVGHLAWLAGIIDCDEPVSAQTLIGEFDWKKVRRTDIVLQTLP